MPCPLFHGEVGLHDHYILRPIQAQSLLRDGLSFTVLALFIGIEPLVRNNGFAICHGFPLAPLHIGADGLALRPGEGAHDGDEHLALGG